MSTYDVLEDLDVFHKEYREKKNNIAKRYYHRSKSRRKIRLREINSRSRLKYLYGITPEIKQQIYSIQKGKCGCCCKDYTIKELVIDHCDDTLVFRGLLCQDCNLGLGRLKHSTVAMFQAIQYLMHPPTFGTEFVRKIPKSLKKAKK